MFSLGISELLLIGLLALIFLGPEQLPEMARVLARFINEWKRATSEITDTIQTSIKEDVVKRVEEKRTENTNPSSDEPPKNES